MKELEYINLKSIWLRTIKMAEKSWIQIWFLPQLCKILVLVLNFKYKNKGTVHIAKLGAYFVNHIFEFIPVHYTSLYQNTSLSVSEFVCLFGCSETANPSELKFWGKIPLGMEKVLGWKNIRIRRTQENSIYSGAENSMYTSYPSGQFYSLQYESSTYLQGW